MLKEWRIRRLRERIAALGANITHWDTLGPEVRALPPYYYSDRLCAWKARKAVLLVRLDQLEAGDRDKLHASMKDLVAKIFVLKAQFTGYAMRVAPNDEGTDRILASLNEVRDVALSLEYRCSEKEGI